MEDTSGFYKKVSDNEWWFAPNFVYHKDYELHRDSNRESIDGWEWFDNAPQEYLDWVVRQELESEIQE
jgi:hypothetical protein